MAHMRNPSVSQKSNIHGKKENTFFHFRRPSFLVSFSGFSGRAAQIKPANHSSFWWCNLRIPFHPEIIHPPYAYCRVTTFLQKSKKIPCFVSHSKGQWLLRITKNVEKSDAKYSQLCTLYLFFITIKWKITFFDISGHSEKQLT